jgi:uncharacterized membrane protein YvlD (DUF360 family)
VKTILKLAALVVLLNIVRYTAGGWIEGFTIMEPMHRPLPLFPEAFDQDFTTTDFMISLGYNYAMWFVAAVVFHLLNPVLRGSIWVRSLKSYLLLAAFFCALAAVYMNHYVAGIRPFYYWSMVDALIVFTVVALANALLHPLFFRDRSRVPGQENAI